MNEKIRVLMVSYEAVPYYKHGGLGDVLGSLPQALENLGVDTSVVIPFYKVVERDYPQAKKIGEFSIRFDKKDEKVEIYKIESKNNKVGAYFLGNHKLIKIINLKRKCISEFLFFDLAVCGFISWLEGRGEYVPDIIHCHDWHTSLIPLLLKKRMKSKIPTVLTIHNFGYQGRGSIKLLDQLELEDDLIKEIVARGRTGKLNSLGEGILHATRVTTVSNQYAIEIYHPRSRGLINKFVRLRDKFSIQPKISGILNGIDTEIWNPDKDKLLDYQFNFKNVEENKKLNRLRLLSEIGLKDRVTIVFIGRMTSQKGLSLIRSGIDRLSKLNNFNLIFLGSGDFKIESYIKQIAQNNPDWIYARTDFSEEFAHRLYAAGDFILIPSLYEPCGLIQMMAMRYGTIPIASRTGGLIDTIDDRKDGYLFKPKSVDEMILAVRVALENYKDSNIHKKMIIAAMNRDFSWKNSAKLYKDLYIDTLNSI